MNQGTSRARTRVPLLRLASWLTLAVLGGATLIAAATTHSVIRDQQRLLLRERTGEAAAVLDSAFSVIQDSLHLLGSVAASGHGASPLFTKAAESVITSPGQGLLVTASRGGACRPAAAAPCRASGMTVTQSAGTAPRVGQALPAAQVALGRRVLSAKGLVSGVLLVGGHRWLALGLGGAAGPGTVVWDEAALAPTTTIKSPPSSPWGNLDIAIYLSKHATPSTLLLSTQSRPILGGVQYPFTVGSQTWLLVTNSPTPLVGTLAQDIPWVIFLGGLLIAAMITALVEALGRRRAYAAAAVEQATTSLRTAMAHLEDAQSQLVRQERLAAVGQLAASVGHELRNPLGVIMNVLYLLEAEALGEDGSPIRRHIATAKRETSAATLIVSDLLDYSAGRQPLLAPVRVRDLVDEALSVAPPPTGVRVDIATDTDVTIKADHDQIRQALLNLISNGYDAMSGAGVLTVSAASAEGQARITVTDTGVGMDAETQANIFTPFYTSKVRGIGLGLAVTKRVVEAHGGTITVTSQPSQGTSFTLAIPAATLAGVAR